MFAKLSATELRSQAGVCTADCTSYACLKGRPDDQRPADVPNGCPFSAHSNALVDNSICSLCTTWCVGRACGPARRPCTGVCRARQRREHGLLPALRPAHLACLVSAPPRPMHSPCSPVPCSVALCDNDNVELRLRPPGIDLW